MASRPVLTILGFGLFLSLTGAASVQGAAQNPITNWTAPATWTRGKAASGRSLSTLSDVSGALPFIAVTPCRIVDTRGATGPYGGPALAAGAPRNFALPGGPCTGIPSTASAYSLNVTVTNTTGPGFILMYPQGGAQPVVSTLNFVAGDTLANAAVVPAGTGGGVTAVAGVHGTDLIIDINGYYAANLNSGEQLRIFATGSLPAIEGIDNSNVGVEGSSGTSTGVYGVSNSGSGVYGQTAGASGLTGAAGVWGNSHDFFGVWGTSVAGDGVHGQSTNSSGVYGLSAKAGVWGDSTGFDGVHGHTTSGTASGVAGFNDANGAGIFGFSNSGDGGFGSGATGLHGVSISGWGVYGHSTVGDGVHGDTIGNNTSGVAGINGGGGFGVYGAGNAGKGVFGTSQSGDGTYGEAFGDDAAGVRAVGTSHCSGHPTVFCSQGSDGLDVQGVARFDNSLYINVDLGVAGSKNFVAPHPSDPAKQIAFVSLEGPESGTYFRGTAKLLGGYAEVSVPESFRLVTSESGLTVVATPTAAAAGLYCVSKSLDKIVFRGSADVEFDYVVNGVRAGYDNYQAIQNNLFFVPKSASDRALSRMPAEALRRLKANGILNDDGSLNEETAHKLGWDQRPGWNRAPQTPPADTSSTRPNGSDRSGDIPNDFRRLHMRRAKRFLAGLGIVIGTAAVTASKSDASPISPEQLHPYVHDGIWETSLILDLPDAPPGTDKPMVRRECMTAAKAESVMKQCRDDEDCRRPCRYKVDPMGPHSARIHVSCTTPQGESTGDFDYRWDSWAGKLTLVRDGKTLMGIRLSGHRVGDCEKAR